MSFESTKTGFEVYFLVRSLSGVTHAINPKTRKTYCGLSGTPHWRPTDELPDDKHQPTCKICQRHYDEPVRESLQQVADELEESIKRFLDTRVMLKDAEGLGRLVTVYAGFIRDELKRAKEKKSKSLVDKRDIIISILAQVEFLEESELIRKLEAYKIEPQEAKELISLMYRDGTIYRPREGVLKKT